MSPILDLQVRFRELGRVRMGAKGSKGEPQKLTKFRLTSASRQILEAAAGDSKIGGTVREWRGAPDEGYFELYTETDALEIVLPPTFSQLDGTPSAPFSQWYELWSGGGCQRRCDGVTEMLKNTACLCDAESRECKITTRINFMLPGLPDIGTWRLDSHGYYAAIETPGTLEILRRAADGRDFIPATLRIEQRTKKTPGGSTRKFVVPIVELRQSIMELAAGEVTGTLAINAPTPKPARAALPAAPPPPDDPSFERPADAPLGSPPPLSDTRPVQGQGADGEPQQADETPGTGGASTFATESDVTEFLELAAKVSEQAHDKAVDGLVKQRVSHGGSVDTKWLANQSSRLLKAKATA